MVAADDQALEQRRLLLKIILPMSLQLSGSTCRSWDIQTPELFFAACL